jgi:hypothetical protein
MGDLEQRWTAAMGAGDYAGAWAASDEWLAARDPATRDDPRMPYHLRWVWAGQPFRDRHVLVRCYHGLGDTIQFARHLPALRRLVASLTVEAQPELLPLLRRVPGPDRLIPFAPHAPSPPSECDIEIMELAHALRAPPEAAPPCYLQAAPAVRQNAIGLCWEAGGWDAERSVPAALIEPLTKHDCVCLQPRPTHLPVLNPPGCSGNIEETAALIAGLDLVVTVDTMVAHLAGALGRPTWLLLKHRADWRWMQDRSDSPWYPSMRLYRQPSLGDWAPVLDQVARDLRARR